MSGPNLLLQISAQASTKGTIELLRLTPLPSQTQTLARSNMSTHIQLHFLRFCFLPYARIHGLGLPNGRLTY